LKRARDKVGRGLYASSISSRPCTISIKGEMNDMKQVTPPITRDSKGDLFR